MTSHTYTLIGASRKLASYEAAGWLYSRAEDAIIHKMTREVVDAVVHKATL